MGAAASDLGCPSESQGPNRVKSKGFVFVRLSHTAILPVVLLFDVFTPVAKSSQPSLLKSATTIAFTSPAAVSPRWNVNTPRPLLDQISIFPWLAPVRVPKATSRSPSRSQSP